VPGTDYYTMTPHAGSGGNQYRDVAGNQFAAAAAGYWLSQADPPAEVAGPLRGLMELSLDSHIAIARLNRPEGPRWGAGHSYADNWHADLFAGTSGMLMHGALPPEARGRLLAILAWEADKQVEYGISREHGSMPGRWPQGSVGESNAWSCALLQTARRALAESSRQAAWREAAILYSLNAISVPDDVESAEVVAGEPLNARVKGANFEPGGIQEHHGFYHPGYMAWPLAYQLYAQLNDEHLPESQRNADVYLRNWRLAFDRLKQSSLANGRFIHAAGDDWNAYGYGNAHILPIGIFAASRFADADASRLAHEWLALMEHEESLIGHALYFGQSADEPQRAVAPGEWIRSLVVAIDCDSGPNSRELTATLTGSHPCFSVHLPNTGTTLAVNFATSEQATDSPAGVIRVAPMSVRVLK